MKSKDRVPKYYRKETKDWEAEYNMLLDDAVTCNECIHVERCCALFAQKPYVNSGRCQFHPNRFSPKKEVS